jgi:hypothetical protein
VWPAYDNVARQQMYFQTGGNTIYANFNEAACNLWDSLGYTFW